MVDRVGNQDTSILQQVTAGMKAEAAEDKLTEKAAMVAADQKANLQEQETEEKNPLAAALRKLDKQIKAHTKTVEKAKEAKQGLKKIMGTKELGQEAQKFSKNPEFIARLIGLTDKLKDGMSRKEILELIHKEYPNPEEASIALQFLMAVSLEDYKETISEVKNDFDNEQILNREKEVSDKIENEAKKVTEQVSEAALKIVQGGDLNKLLDHLMINPLEASAIYNMIDGAYGNDSKKIESFLLKRCGVEINKLKELDDKEDVAHMKNAMALLKKIQAIMGVDRYFEIRNR